MECPKCEAHDIRRSQRHGLYEGLVMRMVFFAPFRCQKCQNRFWAFASGHHSHSRQHTHKTLAGFLGLPKAKQAKFDRTFKIALVALLLILFGVWLALWSAKSPHPAESTYLLLIC